MRSSRPGESDSAYSPSSEPAPSDGEHRSASHRAPPLSSPQPINTERFYWADTGLLLLLWLAPLVLAGRHPLGHLVYLAAIGGTVLGYLAWYTRRTPGAWIWSGSEAILAGGLALGALQCVPLPAEWLPTLSPALREYLALWFTDSSPAHLLGGWSSLSVTPAATRGGCLFFLAICGLFVVLLQRIRRVRDVESILHVISAGTVGLAAIGLLQFLAGNGKFLWIYEHPFRDTLTAVKGPFTNENHFAHFLALGWGPLMFSCWRLLHSARPLPSSGWSSRGNSSRPHITRQLLGAFAVGIVVFAALLTFSRGGLLVVLLSAIVCGVLFVRQGFVSTRVIRWGATIVCAVSVGLLIYGFQPLKREVESLRVASFDEFGTTLGRLAIWKADGLAAKQFWRTGSGIGSHRDVYPLFFEGESYVEFSHAESGYLQVLVETGAIGLTLVIVALFLLARQTQQVISAKRRSLVACGIAISASLLVSAVQSIWDFVWYIPACTTVVAVLTTCHFRLAHFASDDDRQELRRGSRIHVTDGHPIPRNAAFSAFLLAGAAVVVVIMLVDAWPAARASLHWDTFFKQSQSQDPLELLAPTSSAMPSQVLAATESPTDRLRSNIRQLQTVLQRDPHHARASLQLAQSLLLLFEYRQRVSENPMPLSQIRDAAFASKFSTQESLDEWLRAVLGDNRKLLDAARHWALRAVQLNPLQGEGYIYLADLSFLQTRDPDTKRELVQQALRVRPFHGQVLLAAGNEAALEGKHEAAVELWRRAFHRKDVHKIQLIEMLGPRLTGTEFVTAFEPDLDGHRYLYRYYLKTRRANDVQQVASTYLAELERKCQHTPSGNRAPLLREASDVCHAVHDQRGAISCLEAAARDAPQDYATRRDLALRLVAYERFSESIEPLSWCQHRSQDDREVHAAFELASRKKLTPN